MPLVPVIISRYVHDARASYYSRDLLSIKVAGDVVI